MSIPPVADLLPHEPPMILLDDVYSWTDDTARCRVTLRPDSMFVEQGKVRAIVALEYMAQCIGVCTSLRARSRGEPIQRGYLVGGREINLETSHFSVGDELIIEATITYDGPELGSFCCSVFRGDQRLATGVLNVFRQKNEEGKSS